MNLPELTGSQKQIAWAEKIRGSYMKKFLISDDRDFISVQTSAKFFIEHREEYQMREAIEQWLRSATDPNNPTPPKAPEPVPEWKKFEVNTQNVGYETQKAYLINLPHSSRFDGFSFWVSKKLVRPGSHSYSIFISVLDGMQFKLHRKGKSGKVLAEKTIPASELIEAFGGVTTARSAGVEIKPVVETVIHKPEPLKVERKEADAALVR